LRGSQVSYGNRRRRFALDGIAGSRTAVENENGKEKVENREAGDVRMSGGAGCEVPFSSFHFLIF
jgi:hypothetical protein